MSRLCWGGPAVVLNPALGFVPFTGQRPLSHVYARVEPTDEIRQWHDSSGRIIAAFRPGGAVTFKRYDFPEDETLLSKFRRWLGLAK
jgi:hypothetical protein